MRPGPLAVALIALAACATPEASRLPEGATEAPAEPRRFRAEPSLPLPPGLDEAVLDPTQDPCSDFFAYACGGWLQRTDIPADRPMVARGFTAIADRNELVLRGILEEAAAGKLPRGTPFARQLGDFYGTCMDEAKLEKALPEVQRFVARVVQVRTPREVARTVGALHQAELGAFFSLTAAQDLKDASLVVTSLEQGGLGLPDRDYYLDEAPARRAIREAYQAYVAQQLQAFGDKDAARSAAAVLALETRLAKASLTQVEQRDPQRLYNRLDRAGLRKEAGQFAWDDYFAAVGLKPQQSMVNVTSVPFFKEVAAVAKETPAPALRAYLTWVVVRGAVRGLPRAFQDAAFAFNARAFSGATQDRPRWKKCVGEASAALGEALGREFVRRTFPEEAKARTAKMIEALQAAVGANLATLAWMDEPTRAAAQKKLERMVANNKVGYPATWRDYTAFRSSRASFFENLLAQGRYSAARSLAKVGKPVDRGEWLMPPQTVDAYNDGQKNEIVFPAGILQPPFFSQEATDAVNFGSMGMVVGHEITHGFDDEGRQFDADGNLKDWWTEKVAQDFTARAQCVKEQFDASVAVDGLKVNGALTLGENIADLGGLKLAHSAMVEWYSKKPPGEGPPLRYTPSQQFFLGFAQSWCAKLRPEAVKMMLATNPHSPPFLRVNNPVGNLPAFRAAFQCTEKSPLIRSGKDQCAVW